MAVQGCRATRMNAFSCPLPQLPITVVVANILRKQITAACHSRLPKEWGCFLSLTDVISVDALPAPNDATYSLSDSHVTGGREEAIRLDRLAGPDNDMKGLSSCNKLTHNFEVGQ